MRIARIILLLALVFLVTWTVVDFSSMVLGASLATALALLGSFFIISKPKDRT